MTPGTGALQTQAKGPKSAASLGYTARACLKTIFHLQRERCVKTVGCYGLEKESLHFDKFL